MTLAWTNTKPKGVEAAPEILGSFDNDPVVQSHEDWTTRRAPKLRAALQDYVYGQLPDAHTVSVISKKRLDEGALNGTAFLDEYLLSADLAFGDEQERTSQFYMNVLTPIDEPDAPVILTETFCPRWDTIPHPSIARPETGGSCGGDGFGASVMHYVFGRYIATPPLETIIEEGYAFATIFPSEFVPDNEETGMVALKALSGKNANAKDRWGAIAAWGLGYSFMIDVLKMNENAPRAYIAYGHSRYGKAALFAGAFDERVDGVIAHQSGTGGASLNWKKRGESVKSITKAYPHWFSDVYASYAGRENEMPIDQHHLIALVAPRPILLGNARRDVWSDPNGAFRAAMGADPAYELFGARGLDQSRLNEWHPDADIAFWLRPGTHGVVEEDWPAFIEFLDAHFR